MGCGRPKALNREEWNDAMVAANAGQTAAVCGRHDRDYEGEAAQECQELTIARLRQELAVRDERIGRLREALAPDALWFVERAKDQMGIAELRNRDDAERTVIKLASVSPGTAYIVRPSNDAAKALDADDAARGKETGE